MPLRYTFAKAFFFEVIMLKKLIFLLLIISTANAQNTNSNVAVPTSKPPTNAVAMPIAKPSPKPKRTPTPRGDGSGDSGPNISSEMKSAVQANTTIRGRVYYEDTGRSVKRASIMLMSKPGNGGREFSAITDSNGNFQIKNIGAGTYYAMVNAPGVISPFAYADISRRGPDEGLKDAFVKFEPITVNGINDIDVQIPAKRGGAISGRIMYSDGDPAIGVGVQILRKVDDKFIPVIPNFSAIMAMMTQSAGVFQTDDRGSYRFAGLPEGEYIVKVSENATHSESTQSRYGGFESTLFGGPASFLTMFYPDVFDSEKAQIINLALGQETTEINLTIPDRDLHKVEGKVVARKDQLPINNAKITLKRVGDNTFGFDFGENRAQTSTTDDEGKFAFKDIPAGTYKATIVAQNSEFDVKKQVYGKSTDDTDMYPYGPNAPAANSARYAANTAANGILNQKKWPKFSKKIQEITIELKDIDDLKIELGFGATISGNVNVENSEEMPINFTVFTSDEDGESTGNSGIYNGGVDYGDNGEKRPKKADHDFEIEGVSEGTTHFDFFAGDKNFYVKSATFKGTDLLSNPIEMKEGDNIKGLQVILSKDVGTLKGKVSDYESNSRELMFVPTNQAKLKSGMFNEPAKINENGEFEMKLPPFEYAAIFVDSKSRKSTKDFLKFVNENIKDAPKITIEANKTQTLTLKTKK
jgi:Carboxypeptidase regulatory-like domain